MNMKPVIAMRKYDETEFVNIRTYWALSVSGNDATYELQVRHGGGDTFRFYRFEMGDAIELVTADEREERIIAWFDNEDTVLCAHHRNHAEAFIDLCGDCANASRAAAEEWADKTMVVATKSELAINKELLRCWDAFCFGFNPATNL